MRQNEEKEEIAKGGFDALIVEILAASRGKIYDVRLEKDMSVRELRTEFGRQVSILEGLRCDDWKDTTLMKEGIGGGLLHLLPDEDLLSTAGIYSGDRLVLVNMGEKDHAY